MATQARIVRALPCQKQLTKQQELEVDLLNPNVSIINSIEFMKKLTVISVSTITFLRNIFPIDAFDAKKLDGQTVYILKGIDDVPSTKTFINWIKSAFDLVHSHHLRKMMLVVQRDTDTFEVYTFSFTYNHDAIHCDFRGEIDGKEVLREQSQGLPESIAKSVRQLVRSVFVHTSILDPLPSDCNVSVKLLVNDNVSEEILPQCFEPSPDDVFNFPTEAQTLKLGKVESKFINFAVSSKSILYEEGCKSPDVNKEGNIASQVEVDDEVLPGSQIESNQISSLLPSMSQLNKNNSMAAEHDSNTTNLSEKLSVVSLRENIVSCICECSDLLGDTIECVSCSKFQHKTCYKMLECHRVEAHVCIACHDPNQGKICSVPELIHDVNRKESALYRQALIYCCNSSQVSCQKIMTHLKVPRRLAEQLFIKLDVDGCFLASTSKGHIRKVNLDVKESILGRYFSPSFSGSTHMETDHSPSAVPSKEYRNTKRQLEEEKENLAPEDSGLQPKRRRILKPLTKLKNTFYNC